MTKPEVLEWIKGARHITTDFNEYDSSTNHYARDIFLKDGKLYAVEYMNGEIMDHVEYKDNKIIRRGDYIPLEVKEINRVETTYEYVK